MKNLSYRFLPLVLLFFISACSKDDDVGPVIEEKEELLSEFQLKVVSYFKDIALGFEYGDASEVTRKWESPMKIYIEGSPNESILKKVEETIVDINQLATDGFFIEIVDEEDLSNCYMFFGSKEEYIKKFPGSSDLIASNTGFFSLWIEEYTIAGATIFIDTKIPSITQQKSIVLEEITQSLGLGQDSPRFTNSIFFETANYGGYATKYSDLDKELVKLLYHPDMEIGLDEYQIEAVLRSILLSE